MLISFFLLSANIYVDVWHRVNLYAIHSSGFLCYMKICYQALKQTCNQFKYKNVPRKMMNVETKHFPFLAMERKKIVQVFLFLNDEHISIKIINRNAHKNNAWYSHASSLMLKIAHELTLSYLFSIFCYNFHRPFTPFIRNCMKSHTYVHKRWIQF